MNNITKTIMNIKTVLILLLFGVFSTQSAERVTIIHHDHLGSPIIKSDEKGNVIWRANNKPYGKEQNLSPNAIRNSPLQYTGSPYDNYSGLNYMKARYYHPEIGRFMAMDPISFRLNNLTSFNRYDYSSNPFQ